MILVQFFTKKGESLNVHVPDLQPEDLEKDTLEVLINGEFAGYLCRLLPETVNGDVMEKMALRLLIFNDTTSEPNLVLYGVLKTVKSCSVKILQFSCQILILK